MANFLRRTSEAIGKAIPNEFSKLNAFLKYIPLLGQINQGISAIDTGATAFGDTGNFMTAGQAGMQGFSGSIDPGQYGSGYTRTGRTTPRSDIFNTFGNIGNMFNGVQSGQLQTPEISQGSYGNQMSESELMMKQIRSLYAQYLFSQNQAAINPSGSFGVTTTANLYPKL